MKIKKALLKDTFKEIKQSYKRFISILLMALLGVGFFAGLRAASPDMVDSIDKYYKNQNVYDIEIMSTLGLTDDDIQALSNIENVGNIYGTYSKDGLIKTQDKEIVSKILCVEDINKPVLIEGKMPENIDECVVEEKFLKDIDKSIGDTIEIEPESTEGEETEYLKNKTIKIVGIVESPLYISRERGSTKLGTGVINYYIYVNKENVNSEIYTEIYITLQNSHKYQTASNKYEDYVEETKNKIEEIKEERENARYQELTNVVNKEIEKAKWYILDRQQNTGYNSYIQDTESIENLSIVFPIVFFTIAILVSLTSMTRMVEEQRQEIGTLKALGYNKIHIMLKYLIYSSLACIIGGIIGMNIGFQLLPRIIWDMYEMMYTLPEFIISFNHQYSSIGLGLIYICIVGATLYTIIKEVKNTPANLLRPKAPKYGKRVLLERVNFIWKRLKFSHKVTVRNIFRYKKRFLMTIIGIMGCTSLILAGFGLKDSISSILPNQYEDICNYDIQVSLKTSLNNEQKDGYIAGLKQKEEINDILETYMESATAEKDNNSETVQIMVPKAQNEIDKMIKLRDIKTKETFELSEEGIIITDKLSELIKAKVGDMIKIITSDNVEKEIKIVGITENYISHYIYMSKELYQQIYGKEYSTNVLLIQDNYLSEEQEQTIMKEMVAKNEVSTVTLTKTTMKTLDDTMGSLNYVVVILIVSAGLLAFVVLYNLSNINISERIRELATIKVLGFYDREVYDYVTRETILLTLIGIVLGLGVGYFLNSYILGTCEIDMLRFEKVIKPISYVYATAITLIFSIIVNIVTYFALKKIDMIGSLKSVE